MKPFRGNRLIWLCDLATDCLIGCSTYPASWVAAEHGRHRFAALFNPLLNKLETSAVSFNGFCHCVWLLRWLDDWAYGLARGWFGWPFDKSRKDLESLMYRLCCRKPAHNYCNVKQHAGVAIFDISDVIEMGWIRKHPAPIRLER